MKWFATALALSAMMFSFTACDDDDDDTPETDGGMTTDSSTTDAGTADASSTTDAGTSDGSTTDAGTSDGSTTDTDGSTTDTDGSTTDTDGSTTDTDGSTTDTDGSTTDTDGSTTDTDGSTTDTDGSTTDTDGSTTDTDGSTTDTDGSTTDTDGSTTDAGTEDAFAALVQSGDVTTVEVSQYCNDYIESAEDEDEAAKYEKECTSDLKIAKTLGCLDEFVAMYEDFVSEEGWGKKIAKAFDDDDDDDDDDDNDNDDPEYLFKACLESHVSAHAAAIHDTDFYKALAAEKARMTNCKDQWNHPGPKDEGSDEVEVLWSAFDGTYDVNKNFYSCLAELACDQAEYVDPDLDWGGDAAGAMCGDSEAPIYMGNQFADEEACYAALMAAGPACQDEWTAWVNRETFGK